MPVAGILDERVRIPEGVQVRLEGDDVVVAGKGHTLRRKLGHPRVRIAVQGGEVSVTSEYPTKREKALVGTYAAHVRNLILGVTQGFEYEMKVVYSHFPVKVGVKGAEVIIENFLGEKHPRRARILGDTKVEVSGDQVLLRGPDIEAVSQTAANIEQATRIRGFDQRVFQDGIYITKKAGEA
ncbi:MAG: 50S ribosomal protein L6 [Euryarchaeota archaeon RBG_19FT_COMBO_69_17]|uniref:Large ribosomal subunit protein uL6 n=2 Tax=environmental samples TaxID=68359 RepID=A0A0H4TMA2_9EURY|nr:large subunit ribosomal protein L6 [uncultured archaeon]AKQ01704.1 50S ribosomal protein L6, large subunit ribosomal protein L6 [uncultured euryarchaeote Rifle_16ft_4_minimus_23719]AKQ02708.1 50S ribosomal protein L6, large subunit ribosomal protein L6 [uncultured euryarchaeote Rifle_16ft_4_minimus_37664]OGS62142.1 MAG: 50S ribosomal protein L6 [Euryarchaeota archaeon RBG_19FT_COMBO_69_17]